MVIFLSSRRLQDHGFFGALWDIMPANPSIDAAGFERGPVGRGDKTVPHIMSAAAILLVAPMTQSADPRSMLIAQRQ